MRKIYLALAGVLAFGLVATSADAAVLGNSNGLRAAAEDLSVVETVHCIPGFGHHGYRPHDGCFRGIVVAPRLYGGYRGGYRGGFRGGGFRGGFRGGRGRR
jgi:hypothetical protein